MELAAIQSLLSKDLAAIDHLINETANSNIHFINDLSQYIIRKGGKRLRPMVLLLSAHACGYTGPHAQSLAAAIEFIHTATLLHDDIVDNSPVRRAQPSVNARWGNEAAVLLGDFLYSRAFQLMVKIEDIQIMRILANAANTIAEGEVLQLLARHNLTASEESYITIIQHKTAKLFEAAAQLGAVLSKQSDFQQATLDYGKHLGLAFQLMDDALDYQNAQVLLGKPPGNDFLEGKMTLPLIYALKHAPSATVQQVQEALHTGGQAQFIFVQKIVENQGGLEYTISLAQQEAEKACRAMQALPQTPYRTAACALAQHIVSPSVPQQGAVGECLNIGV